MKTPYDAAIRINRQALDQIRVQVSRQTDIVDSLVTARDAVDQEVRAEAKLARDIVLPFVNYGAYAQRKRTEAAIIEAARVDAEQQLDSLLDNTQEAFGNFKTLDTAAGRWQEVRYRDANRREQNAMDEMASRSSQTTRAA